MSQAQLAKAVGVSPTTISTSERVLGGVSPQTMGRIPHSARRGRCMNTEPTVGTLWREMLGRRVTTVCPGVPAWTLYEHQQVDMAVLTTSLVFVQHTVENVAGGKRLVRRHRRVVIGLS